MKRQFRADLGYSITVFLALAVMRRATVATYPGRKGPIPRKANVDAMHIAIASVHGIDYLLTRNCTHIANAAMRSQIESICRTAGYEPPVLCTPEELMED